MPEVGFNYRLTDIQCALGLSQLHKLDNMVSRRAEIVSRYNAAFSALPDVQTPQVSDFNKRSSRIGWHLYVLQIDFRSIGKTRTQVMQELRERGVGTQVHYVPVHLQPYYRQKYGYGPGKCPVAEAYYQRCLTLPLYPTLTDSDVQRVIDALGNVVLR
jgi:dTDP-4-amino-4,6-dideoxygalactose transaminase